MSSKKVNLALVVSVAVQQVKQLTLPNFVVLNEGFELEQEEGELVLVDVSESSRGGRPCRV